MTETPPEGGVVPMAHLSRARVRFDSGRGLCAESFGAWRRTWARTDLIFLGWMRWA